MFVVRRHFPLWLYDSLKPLNCLSPYPLCLGMCFTPSISEKNNFFPLFFFLKDASAPVFWFFSAGLLANANAFWEIKVCGADLSWSLGQVGLWERWLCAPVLRRVPSCTCGSLRVQRHIRVAVFVWVPLAIRAQPCRPGLRMKISARFEWVQSFSYANGMH